MSEQVKSPGNREDGNRLLQFPLPTGWKFGTIGTGITLVSGQHIEAKEYNNSGLGVPYITGPADFANRQITITKYTTSPKAICEPGDILITVKGSGAGKIVRADNQYCISRQLMAIRPLRIDSEFLYQFLLSKEGGFSGITSGLIPGISRSEVLSTSIPLPPLPEQRKIAAILSTWDRAIELVEQRIQAAERRKWGLMQLTMVSLRWERRSLGDLVKLIGGGTPSKFKKEYWFEGTIPWVSPKDIKSRNLWESSDYITEEAVKSSATALVPKGSVIIVVRSGILQHSFPVAMAKVDLALNQDLKALIPLSDIDGEYLAQYLYLFGRNVLKSCAKVGTTVESIDSESLRDYPIALPPMVEQRKIAAMLSAYDTEITLLHSEHDALRRQKRGLMQQLLTGRIRVSVDETTEEPIRANGNGTDH